MEKFKEFLEAVDPYWLMLLEVGVFGFACMQWWGASAILFLVIFMSRLSSIDGNVKAIREDTCASCVSYLEEEDHDGVQ